MYGVDMFEDKNVGSVNTVYVKRHLNNLKLM